MADRLSGYSADESYNARVILYPKGITHMFASRLATIGGYKGAVNSSVTEAVMINNDNLYLRGKDFAVDECITRWREAAHEKAT